MGVSLTSIETKLLRKTVAHAYNKINQEFYATGVISQRIEVFANRFIIFAKHKRVPALKVLSENYSELTTYADAALVSEFKLRLKKEIENKTGISVVSVLKDYDTNTEDAFCVIVFDEKVCSKV